MWQVEMVQQLKTAPSRERKRILADYSERTGYSATHLYTVARQHGFDSGYKRRSDAGTTMLTESQIEFVAGLMSESSRENKGVIMPVECALEIAIDNGRIERGQVSVGRMQQILKERQLNKDSLDAATPHTDMRSLHPNYCHQIDASVCIQYYLRSGKTALIDERDYNAKKMQNMAKIKTRITRYLLTDHFSGLFYVKYYLADGESQKLLYDFITSAWSHKQDDRYPFRGVPFFILWDAASAAKARAMQSLIDGLGIKTPPGMPHNPRRQGSVESTQNIVERWFESKLRFEPAFGIEQLCAWAQDWQINHNATRNHTRHGMTRTASWMLIKQEQLRELPEMDVLNALFSYTAANYTRLVGGNYQISFSLKAGEQRKYWLKHIPGLLAGRSSVQVKINPYLWPKINVLYNNVSYEAEPIEMLPAHLGSFRVDAPIIGESYAAMPETLTQQAGKRIENYAYGETREKDAVPYAGITVMGNQADKIGNVAYLPKRGHAIEIDRDVAEKQVSVSELIMKLSAAGVEMTKELNRELRAKYGDSLDAREAEGIVARVRQGDMATTGQGEPEKGGEGAIEAEAM